MLGDEVSSLGALVRRQRAEVDRDLPQPRAKPHSVHLPHLLQSARESPDQRLLIWLAQGIAIEHQIGVQRSKPFRLLREACVTAERRISALSTCHPRHQPVGRLLGAEPCGQPASGAAVTWQIHDASGQHLPHGHASVAIHPPLVLLRGHGVGRLG